MEIVAEFKFTEQLDDKGLRDRLKAQGVDARRLSRFTQLALLGALPLKDHLSKESNIYLGANFNSPSKFSKMFKNLQEHHLPSPLDFMANINNAATFHLAQVLGIGGQSLFLALDKNEQASLFQLAELDLAPGQTALVGWVFERYQETQQDESWWRVVKGI